MSLSKDYHQLVAQQALSLDNAQLAAITALDQLSLQLTQLKTFKYLPPSLSDKLSRKLSHKWRLRKKPAIQGIYFHGRVGRGKTMLMDMFYHGLAITRKKRIHFHHFMEQTHLLLAQLDGCESPLMHIARTWAEQIDLLCFDEFFVSDIGDAMLIAGLLSAMISQGITLVATSNSAPDMLYLNGLQRSRFLPTIEIINQHCQVISIDGEQDHRMVHHSISQSPCYHDYSYPLSDSNDFAEAKFNYLARGHISYHGTIDVLNRKISYLARADNIITFDFIALCSAPRSQRDYIKLADHYPIVIVTHVPQFNGELIPAVFSGVEDSYQRNDVVMGTLRALDDEARRFIALVDEFYDRNIRLIISAEVDIAQLYQGTQLAFEFARTQSRLVQMQSLCCE